MYVWMKMVEMKGKRLAFPKLTVTLFLVESDMGNSPGWLAPIGGVLCPPGLVATCGSIAIVLWWPTVVWFLGRY